MAENVKKPRIEHITVNKDSKVPVAQTENLMVLPDEILLHVLSHLSIYDILLCVALVCKRFYNLSKDSSLIFKIYAEKNNDEEQSFHQKRITASQNMTALLIKGYERENMEFLVTLALKSCPRLKYLEVEFEYSPKEENVEDDKTDEKLSHDFMNHFV